MWTFFIVTQILLDYQWLIAKLCLSCSHQIKLCSTLFWHFNKTKKWGWPKKTWTTTMEKEWQQTSTMPRWDKPSCRLEGIDDQCPLHRSLDTVRTVRTFSVTSFPGQKCEFISATFVCTVHHNYQCYSHKHVMFTMLLQQVIRVSTLHYLLSLKCWYR